MTKGTPNLLIESGIPLPTRPSTGLAHTMRSMTRGDSFAVPTPKTLTHFYATAKEVGIKVSVRKVSAEITRVWRTA